MEQSYFPEKPLKKIALSLSGGGYRATVFHLGSMSYLNRLQFNGKPLLENVEMISTVSGGTITGIVYAMMKHDKKSFQEVYEFLLNTLKNLDLLKGGFELLDPGKKWDYGKKNKNLINAFALQYEEAFTQGKLLGDLSSLDSHLKAVVFNTTEFDKGINFRFKNSSGGYSGNFYNRIYFQTSKHVRLSDIMAASSCFPGGFEPMLWPDDFMYKGWPDELKPSPEDKVTGIMDGGIYDNQGIESILNYKKADMPYFDLVIISDVASPFMEPYKPYEEKKATKKWENYTIKSITRTLKRTNLLVNILLYVGLALAIGQLVWSGFPDSRVAGICLAASIVLILFIAVKWAVLNALGKKKKKLKAAIDAKIPFFADKFEYLKMDQVSFHRLKPLLVNRANSLVTLLMDVFLKIVRRLNYQKLYEDERYQYRRISNLVRELVESDYKGEFTREEESKGEAAELTPQLNYDKEVGQKIKAVVERAASFGTTLWFTDQDNLDDMLMTLVASGQITMCYNMIVYLQKLLSAEESANLDTETMKSLRDLLAQCEKDWETFKKDPMIMTKDLNF